MSNVKHPKRSKEAVDYGRGMKAAHCGICRHFLAPDHCSRVAGKVSAQGWCRLWMKLNKDEGA